MCCEAVNSSREIDRVSGILLIEYVAKGLPHIEVGPFFFQAHCPSERWALFFALAFQIEIEATTIFLLGGKRMRTSGHRQDGSMVLMQLKLRPRKRRLYADIGMLHMATVGMRRLALNSVMMQTFHHTTVLA